MNNTKPLLKSKTVLANILAVIAVLLPFIPELLGLPKPSIDTVQLSNLIAAIFAALGIGGRYQAKEKIKGIFTDETPTILPIFLLAFFFFSVKTEAQTLRFSQQLTANGGLYSNARTQIEGDQFYVRNLQDGILLVMDSKVYSVPIDSLALGQVLTGIKEIHGVNGLVIDMKNPHKVEINRSSMPAAENLGISKKEVKRYRRLVKIEKRTAVKEAENYNKKIRELYRRSKENCELTRRTLQNIQDIEINHKNCFENE